jgi:hypothetical protein
LSQTHHNTGSIQFPSKYIEGQGHQNPNQSQNPSQIPGGKLASSGYEELHKPALDIDLSTLLPLVIQQVTRGVVHIHVYVSSMHMRAHIHAYIAFHTSHTLPTVTTNSLGCYQLIFGKGRGKSFVDEQVRLF